MIRQDIRELKSGPRELRKFGLMVGGVLCLFGLLFWARGRPHWPWLAPGLVLMVLGAVWARLLKPVYLVWMVLAIVLGFIVSHVLLTIFFFLVITPIGLAARLARKDFLRLRLERHAPSYWLARKPETAGKENYEKQF